MTSIVGLHHYPQRYVPPPALHQILSFISSRSSSFIFVLVFYIKHYLWSSSEDWMVNGHCSRFNFFLIVFKTNKSTVWLWERYFCQLLLSVTEEYSWHGWQPFLVWFWCFCCCWFCCLVSANAGVTGSMPWSTRTVQASVALLVLVNMDSYPLPRSCILHVLNTHLLSFLRNTQPKNSRCAYSNQCYTRLLK